MHGLSPFAGREGGRGGWVRRGRGGGLPPARINVLPLTRKPAMSESPSYTLRLAHLYPTLMNLYGDRGNIITLRRRCEARGITLEIDEIGLGDTFDKERYDLIFIGGGQD